MRLIAALAAAAATLSLPTTAAAQDDDSGWRVTPFGRINYDIGGTWVPDDTGRKDGYGAELRRARVGLEGEAPGGSGFKAEIDVADNDLVLTDGFVTYTDGALKLTLGQHNNFQSLEELTSSRFTSQIERAAFTDAFGFERRIGASAQYTVGDTLLQGGAFLDNLDDMGSGQWSVDGRAVRAPKLGDTRLHLGASLHYTRLGDEQTVRYRQRPLVHFTDIRFVDTSTIAATSELGAGLEAAAMRGPFHAAAETYWQRVERPGTDSAGFFGAYAEAGVFLTPGDTRSYKGAKFDRVKPKHPLGQGGIGAVQINARYDRLDLTDRSAGIAGGVQDGMGLALVWTPTANTRLTMNYARLWYNGAIHPGIGGNRNYAVDALGIRGQVDF